MSGTTFATVAGIYNDGVSLIFDGTATETTKHYKVSTTASIAVGDRVKLLMVDGTAVVEYSIGTAPIEQGGIVFTPSVSAAGVISWTNNGGKPNPPSRSIMGPQGDPGDTGPEGPAGPQGADGNGITSIVQNADDSLTITLEDGTSYTTDPVRGPQGEQGQQGPAGAAAVISAATAAIYGTTGTPNVQVTTGGTPASRSFHFVFYNLKGDRGDRGEPGQQGPEGPAGADGADGQDGVTPVRGVDYWTDEDKTEIVTDVIDELVEILLWTGGNY